MCEKHAFPNCSTNCWDTSHCCWLTKAIWSLFPDSVDVSLWCSGVIPSLGGPAAGRWHWWQEPSVAEASLLLAGRLLLKLQFSFHEGFYDANILSTTLKILPLKTVSHGSGPSQLQTTRGKSAIYCWQVTGRKGTQISKPVVTLTNDLVSGFGSYLTCFYSALVVSSNIFIPAVNVGMEWVKTSSPQPRDLSD